MLNVSLDKTAIDTWLNIQSTSVCSRVGRFSCAQRSRDFGTVLLNDGIKMCKYMNRKYVIITKKCFLQNLSNQ